jgi:hypothetical protein
MNPRKWPDLAVPCPFPESARKILGAFGVRKIRYGYPGLVITGTRLEREKGRLTYSS